jgi:UPF0176 protein
MSSDAITIVAYYKFVSLPDFEQRRQPLLEICETNRVKGTILLAAEGINSTIAGTEEGIEAVLNYLQRDPILPNESSSQKRDRTPWNARS